ncbi:MAG: hypothetical protein GWN58_24650, partial [Anaerolineae bacterium]|nr:hypothetical protein [Anaerolineae bacterium]
MKEPPKSRSYERPGEFINAWARLSAGDEVPAPTAQLPDNTPITQDLANLKE